MQQLLRDEPVFFHEPTASYYVLPYAQARSVLTDWETYSNAMSKAMPVRDDLRDRIPEEHQRVGRQTHHMITNMDPPEHTLQRRAAQRAFTHRRIRALESRIEGIANAAVDEIADRGSCDLLQDYAQKVTLRVIATLLDIPDALLPDLQSWISDVFMLQAPSSSPPRTSPCPTTSWWSGTRGSTRPTAPSCRSPRSGSPTPATTSVRALTLTEPDGTRALSNDHALAYMIALTAAGTDTTANLIVNMVRYFTEAPDQLQRLRDQPELWDNAVAEGLRRSSIAQQKYRISRAESEILGLRIPAGARVAVSVAAEQRPSVFEDPLRFDVDRPNASKHLPGTGAPLCLGGPW